MKVPGLQQRSTVRARSALSGPSWSVGAVAPAVPAPTDTIVNESASRAAATGSSRVIPPRPGLAPWPTFSSKASRPDSSSRCALGSL